MRRLTVLLLSLGLLAGLFPAAAATGKVIKVLPQFLDQKGRAAKSPSLFDRDAYQAWLRDHPKERSGIRYAVQWRAREPYGSVKLRLEVRGLAEGDLPREKTLEKKLKTSGTSSHWEYLELKDDLYKEIGDVTAWRVTLWDGDQLLDEQASFLWNASGKPGAGAESKPETGDK